MKTEKTKYSITFNSTEKPIDFFVDHDPESTGIDVLNEYERYKEIGDLTLGYFMSNPEDFSNFLWSELGLMSSFKV